MNIYSDNLRHLDLVQATCTWESVIKDILKLDKEDKLLMVNGDLIVTRPDRNPIRLVREDEFSYTWQTIIPKENYSFSEYSIEEGFKGFNYDFFIKYTIEEKSEEAL